MGRTNDEISLIKKAFFEMYDTDLSVMVNDEISGDFLAVIMKALQVMRELGSVGHRSSQSTKRLHRSLVVCRQWMNRSRW